jgi:RNA recognition motif-containing protein
MCFYLYIALLIRGIDALTTEETIENTIKAISNIIPKNTYIARDRLTNLSNGFCLTEFNTLSEATQVIETIALNSKFEIDGKCVQVDYSKNNFLMA